MKDSSSHLLTPRQVAMLRRGVEKSALSTVPIDRAEASQRVKDYCMASKLPIPQKILFAPSPAQAVSLIDEHWTKLKVRDEWTYWESVFA